MKGQHFGFLCVLCIAWISTRVAVLSSEPIKQPFHAEASVSRQLPNMQGSVTGTPGVIDRRPISRCCLNFAQAPSVTHFSARYRTVIATTSSVPLASSTRPIPALPAATAALLAPYLAPQPPPAIDPQSSRRLQIYAYHFWRGGGGFSPLGSGRYGGGQSGGIATYRVAPQFSLLARAAVAHDDVREREVAAGVRWLPVQSPGFTLTAEHRLRNSGSRSVAVYVAGGKSALPLPLQFQLDAYGQAGFVSGRSGGSFFDAQARVEREIVAVEDIALRAGSGIWAGGQKGIARLDAGPSISSTVKLGEASIRLDADWRFRIAGDARPASGPALTLSTSF